MSLDPQEKDVERATARGLFWTLSGTIATRLATLVSLALLARVLSPKDFGLLAFALTFITYAETIGDLGTGMALIYWPTREREAAQITLLINVIMGFLWWALAYWLSPWVAEFFRHPEATPILRALAWTFPLKYLGNTHDALSLKRMRFKLRLLPELGMSLTKACLSVVLAFAGFGVWSLVWGQLAGVAVWTVGLWWLIPWRPTIRTPLHLLTPMLRYGRGIVAVNVLAATVHHADYVVVGRMLGATALGFYQMAYKVPEMSVTLLVRVASRVLFPSFSKINSDLARLKRVYLEILRYGCIAIVPGTLMTIVLAEPLVLTLFGAEWKPAIPILRALAGYAGIRALGTHSGDILKAIGRPGLLASLGVGKAIVLLPLLALAGHSSALAVGLTMAGVASGFTVLNLLIIQRILKMRVEDVFRALWPGLGIGATVFSVVLVSAAILGEVAAPLSLARGILVGSAAYIFSIRVLQPKIYRDFSTKLAEAVSGRLRGSTRTLGTRTPSSPGDGRESLVLARVSRFVVPVAERRIVKYFLDSLFVPYTRWEKLTFPMVRYGPSRVFRWLQADPFGRKTIGDADQDETYRSTRRLLSGLSGNGGDVLQDSLLGDKSAFHWLLLRDYELETRERLVAFLFVRNDPRPKAILKLRPLGRPGRTLQQEWDALRTVSRLNSAIADSLPAPLAFRTTSNHEILISSCLSGRSAYVEMHRPFLSRRRIALHFSSAAEWLARFHSATRSPDPSAAAGRALDPESLWTRLAEVDAGIDLSRFEERLETWSRSPLSVVSGHGDYWARNVLIDHRPRNGTRRHSNGSVLPGVIDWEHFRPEAPFFDDLFHFPLTYGLNYPWAGHRTIEKSEALRRTFLERNIVSVQVRDYFERYCRMTGIDGGTLEDLFHVFLLYRLPGNERPEERRAWLQLHLALQGTDRSVFSG